MAYHCEGGYISDRAFFLYPKNIILIKYFPICYWSSTQSSSGVAKHGPPIDRIFIMAVSRLCNYTQLLMAQVVSYISLTE